MEIKINGFFKVEQGLLSLPLVKEAPAIQTLSGWRVVFAALFKGGVVAVLEKDNKKKVYVLKRDMASACGLASGFKLQELEGFISKVREQASVQVKVNDHADEIEKARIKNRQASAAFLQSQKLFSEQGSYSPERLRLLEEAASLDHIQALYLLGKHYSICGKDQPERGQAYFQRAAQLGHQPSLKMVRGW